MAIVARAAGSIRDHDPALPATLDEIIGRMLCKEPDERFASMAEVRTALRELAPPGGRPVETAPASVAVLPFSRISASQEDDYFVDGMVEEIISRLSRIGGLKVISRTSVMQYKDHTEELEAIGKRLGVTTVVEGSVRRAADRFRVAARLVTVDSGQQLWSEVYDRPVGDLFAVQDDVSEEIASALRLKLSANTRRRMTGARAETLETYNEYLKARYSMNKWTPEGIETGIRHFKRAVALDPEFARGYAGLSICHAYSGHLGYVPFNVAFPAAKKAADQALQLDDTLAEAHTSLALVSLLHEWDWTAADGHFRKAVDLDPNSSATHLHYSWCFLAQGQPARAISEASLAVTLDPLSASNQMVMGWVQFYSGLYVESLVHYRKALELEPDHTLTRNQIGGTYAVLGRHDEAIEMLRDPVNPMHLAWVYAIVGRPEEGERLVEKLRAGGGKTPVTNMDLGVFHLLTGDLDEGFRLLDEAYEERDSRLPYMPDHPFLTQVRSDPRMTRLRDRIGLYADPV